MWLKYALKGQKPYKLPGILKLLPLQGDRLASVKPRAMPWARSFCPFRACCFWSFSPLLFPSTGNHWFRACGGKTCETIIPLLYRFSNLLYHIFYSLYRPYHSYPKLLHMPLFFIIFAPLFRLEGGRFLQRACLITTKK